jgi:hypothetical protein
MLRAFKPVELRVLRAAFPQGHDNQASGFSMLR